MGTAADVEPARRPSKPMMLPWLVSDGVRCLLACAAMQSRLEAAIESPDLSPLTNCHSFSQVEQVSVATAFNSSTNTATHASPPPPHLPPRMPSPSPQSPSPPLSINAATDAEDMNANTEAMLAAIVGDLKQFLAQAKVENENRGIDKGGQTVGSPLEEQLA